MPRQTFIRIRTIMATIVPAAIFVVLVAQPLTAANRSAAPAQAQAPAGAVARPAGNAENGKALFVKYGCYECHGREGQGANTGPKVGPNPLPLPALARY